MAYIPSRGQFKGVEFAGRGAYRQALAIAKTLTPSPSGAPRHVYVPKRGALYGTPFRSYYAYRSELAKAYGFSSYAERRRLTSQTGAKELTAIAKQEGVRPTKSLYQRLQKGLKAGYTVDSTWLRRLVAYEQDPKNRDKGWYH